MTATPDTTGPARPETTYRVVRNDEEQYSLWPVDRELPSGWYAEGTAGTEQACLDRIDEVWTDMRPLSLRRWMEEHGDDPADLDDAAAPDGLDGPSLVDRLSEGEHPLEASLRPEPALAELRTAIERGHVFVRFTSTRGGTELGLELDRTACELADGDLESGSGRITLVGDLVLDWEPVRCTAHLDLATLAGTGRLERTAAR